jgi:dipeptidyl aminopeptidase/acylaminoacyl peptidase
MSSKSTAVKSGPGKYSRLTWDRKQRQLAFLFDGRPVSSDPKVAPAPRPKGWEPPDSPPEWRAYVWDRSAKKSAGALAASAIGAETEIADAAAQEVFGPDATGMREGWVLSGNSLRFSDDGKRLFVSTGPRREPAPRSNTPESNKVELDIWHWKDGYPQPMQRVRGNNDQNRTYSAIVFLDSKEFRQLSDESLSVGAPGEGDWALGYDESKYLHLTGYAYPVPRDYALVNVRTGERKSSLTAFNGFLSLSPTGKHLLVYDGKDWSTISIPDGKKTNLTGKLAVKFFDEEDDHPHAPPAYGSLGWTTDGKFVLVHDRFDIWKLAADGSTVVNLTKIGREKDIRFRYVRIRDDSDDDARGIDLSKPMLLAAENLQTRDTGFFRLEPGSTPKLLIMGARRYGNPVKAKDADVYILTVQTFSDYPDYYVTGPDFHELKRVTDVNPQVRRFNWGKAELVQYRSADGLPLSGVLIKPENFDPSKKYPMVVYIYERLTSNLHSFRLPSAGTSINPTYYASNGYLVYMPDIAYTVGYPGQSALKCVLPAIQAVVDQGFVDEKGIGIQGHSWGGYQIAYMVTQTNRFKAAIAGAPVSNMVSAYGGIRWGTGLPRQFQYEQTQSRIGDTLWNAPMRYIENSPIFMADRVATPLLMLHNDQDGAVPWYQGIEYFLALRRLGKECYMLNYNGEDHGLRKKQNQEDYTVRMSQFFDHHLKGKPAPKWMAEGVPYVDRDKEKESIRKVLEPAKK